MIAFKSLRAGAVGPFSGFRWPRPDAGTPGSWVDSGEPLEMCVRGVHASRSDHLPYWISSELWVVELEEPVIEQGHAVMARRGRLLRLVEEWNGAAGRAFAESCAASACELAGRFLRDAGLLAEAEKLSAAEDIKEAGAIAATLRAETSPPVADILGYATDAAAFAPQEIPALIGHIAARAGGFESTGGVHDDEAYLAGVRSERDRQARWLVEHLGLYQVVGANRSP
ncbi:MAG: hypothetical protein M3124_07580 [Actinomycetota bacterium]|nr:hypothetical protein [Actinomycetota bacterium]